MENKGRYPEYIIKFLRMRRGLDENDTHLDWRFQGMEASRVFVGVLFLDGLLCGWDSQIKGWVQDIYGVGIDAMGGNE